MISLLQNSSLRKVTQQTAALNYPAYFNKNSHPGLGLMTRLTQNTSV